ncbi:MAG TPA: hypothetical protein VFY65_02510 [Longimicrobium sp.]|nr:hypothetical protein [Longimicrobium sp.]
MALREFKDSSGTTWTAWDVPPHRVYTTARAGADRRTRVVPGWTPERRVRERRMRLRHPELSGGWVCFASEREKRRLSPPPQAWDAASDAELEALCAQARSQPASAE